MSGPVCCVDQQVADALFPWAKVITSITFVRRLFQRTVTEADNSSSPPWFQNVQELSYFRPVAAQTCSAFPSRYSNCEEKDQSA